MTKKITEHEGVKYQRVIYPADGQVSVDKEQIFLNVDVYCVLEAFQVRCPAVQHAIKKLLCLGQRGKGDKLADLMGVEAAVARAIELEKLRIATQPKKDVVFTEGAQMFFPTPEVPVIYPESQIGTVSNKQRPITSEELAEFRKMMEAEVRKCERLPNE